MTAVAYAVTVLALTGCAAYAHAVVSGHERPGCLRRTAGARATRTALRVLITVLSVSPVRAAVVRVRWAWRCRGKPVPGDGEKLTREESQVLGNLDAGRDVRSRT